MPILGSIDSATFANDVAVTNDSAAVTRNVADAIAGGDVIVLANVSYYVKSVDGTTVTLAQKYAGATDGTLSGAKRRTPPKALSDFVLTRATDHQSSVDTQIVAVSLAEAQLSTNKARGISSPGWWAYRTYTDASGTTRHKSELIASYKDGSAISGDFTDDAWAGDVTSLITISSQPTDAIVYFPAGAVGTFTSNGAADGSRTAGTYTVTDAAGSASGAGADFTVVVAADGTPTVTLVSGGTGYVDDETITIADASLGGGGGAAVVLTVTAATAANTFSVTASSTGAGASITYQWQISTNSGTNFSDVSGATNQTLALTGLTATENGNQYRVKVNNSIGGVEVISTVVTLTTDSNA